MSSQSNYHLIPALKSCSRIASVTVVFVGFIALVGWALDIEALKSVFPNLATMKANAALCFALAGLSLWLLQRGVSGTPARSVAYACALIVALIGLLTLCEYIFGWNLHIDELLFQDTPKDAGTIHPGRMSPVTALNFLLLGAALLILGSRPHRAAEMLVFAAALISLLAFAGYIYGAQSLYAIRPYSSIALHTTVSFIVLCLGVVFAHPDRGFIAIVTTERAGGILARRLLPAAILVPLILGWFRLEGQRMGYFGLEFGTALFAIANLVVFAILIWWNASALSRTDITRRQAQHMLRASEEKYRLLFENNPLPMWVFDLETLRFLAVNESAIHHYGYSMDEFLLMTIKDIRPPEDTPALLDHVSKETIGIDKAGAWRHRKKDGTVIDVEITSHTINFSGKRADLVLANDITERKRVEEAKRASEERFSKAFSASPIPMSIVTYNEGRYIDVNESYLRNSGYAREEIIGRTTTDINLYAYPEERDRLRKILEEQGRIRNAEVYRRVKSGEVRVALASSEIITLDGERCILTTSEDITERKRVEDALRASESRKEAILESVLDCIITMDCEGKVIEFNPAAESTFGYGPDEVIGKPMAELIIPPSLREAHHRGFAHYLATGEGPVLNKRIELMAMRANGTEFPVELTVTAISSQATPLFTGFIRDITNRKRAEATLRESEQRFRSTFEQAAVGIAHVGLDGKWLRVNQKLCNIVGYTREELLEGAFQDITHPDDLDADLDCVNQVLAGKIHTYSMRKRYIRKDGSHVWINLTVSLVRERTGEPKYFISVIEDITERKQAEQLIRDLNVSLEHRVVERTAQLEAANKELEAFSYSVSHDLRAPLRHIDGFAQLLAKREGERLDPASSRYLRIISESVGKMGQLIDELLAFSRTTRKEIQASRIELGRLIAEAQHELAPAMKGRSIKWEIGPLPAVEGDPVLLRLVLVNLLSNAIKYTRPRSEACIALGATEDDGDKVTVFIRDNGVGFDMQYADKLFGVFQRLHREEEFEGTGIGLATVRRIVNRHGGAVWAEGEPGRGATFYLTLRKAKGKSNES